jgi:predicted kinase
MAGKEGIDGSIVYERERGGIKFKPCVVVLSGLPLTGKSTLAERMVGIEEGVRSNFVILDVDDIRKDIDPTRRAINQDTGETIILPPILLPDEQEFSIMNLVYGAVCFEAARLSLEGKPVAIAGAFARPEIKKPLMDLEKILAQAAIPFRIFELEASEEELRARIEQRKLQGTSSNIDSWEKLEWLRRFYTSIDFTEVTRVNMGFSYLPDQVQDFLDGLRLK